MKFVETCLDGAFLIEAEPAKDERGLFARTFCELEFRNAGLATHFGQCSTSYSRHCGTLRGMHYQTEPHEEVKLVRCTRGAVYDVIVDLRRGSRTFCKWLGAELTAENRRSLYVPKGFAHGFQTLSDDAELYYQISAPYVPEAARGVRWDDPAFCIIWPLAEDRIMSERDRHYPDFTL